MAWSGIEPATSKSRVRRANHTARLLLVWPIGTYGPQYHYPAALNQLLNAGREKSRCCEESLGSDNGNEPQNPFNRNSCGKGNQSAAV
ncbi:hypothetical protein ElyMa_006124700 [Elysia marginata]|uniref:Uncharacterized protein n=1 Tax=Elysia marginata TaxID=1093978 RepID=A0AAV4GWW7_9GAST|nr:hypothetical protein ElyMa_006124700 [Elysia marginata]